MNPDLPRLLLVDDEEFLLSATRRVIRSKHQSWQVMTSTDPVAALGVVKDQDIDVVVSDLWMPGMNGVDFLGRVAALRPAAIRILLSGGSGPDPEVMPEGIFHLRFDKPCNHLMLILGIENALGIRPGSKHASL